MSRLNYRAVVAVALASLAFVPAAAAAPGDRCSTSQCSAAVRSAVRAAWRAEALPHARWIASTIRCESGGHGLYRLHTTGNGFWFAGQFTPSTWASVGGRLRAGRPVGVWSTLPDRAEQDARMVRVLRSQGRRAWPRCG